MGLVGLAVEHAAKRCREVPGHHEGGVVGAGAHTVEGLLLVVDERPAKLGVLLELLLDHVTGVYLAHVAYLGALVLDHDGDGHRARVLVGVPVREDVEPRVEGGDDRHADGDDDGDGVRQYSLEVALEDLERCSHVETPCAVRFRSAYIIRGLVARQAPDLRCIPYQLDNKRPLSREVYIISLFTATPRGNTLSRPDKGARQEASRPQRLDA